MDDRDDFRADDGTPGATPEAPASPSESTLPSAQLPPTEGPGRLGRGDADLPTASHRPGRRPGSDDLEMTLQTPSLPDYRAHGYQVLELIGKGGMGVVYRAVQLSLGRPVALKVLPPGFAGDTDRLHRFQREIEVAAGLVDERIVRVYDSFWADGGPVLVMPYLEGPNLGEVLRDRRAVRAGEPADGRHPWSTLPDREFLAKLLPVLDQLVEAVASMHRAGAIHRDIKPSNSVIDDRGQLHLIDFGLARLAGSSRITTDARMGTPGYMSPEQWDASPAIDARADVFGLGATLYHALAGRLPYGKGRLGHAAPTPKGPSALTSGLHPDYDAVILHALELEADDRYASAVDLRDDWKLVRAHLPPKVRRLGPVRRGLRWLARRPSAVAILVLVGLLASSLGLVAMMVPPDPDAPRRVRVVTGRPIARLAFIPLDPLDGLPRPRSDRAVRGRGTGGTIAELDVTPGDYLLVVQWDRTTFHEVYRHVPRPGDRHGNYSHLEWQETGGLVILPQVPLPPPDPTAGMARFAGAAHFSGPTDALSPAWRRDEPVGPFYLDTEEVTVARHKAAWPGLPVRMADRTWSGADPVRDIEFDAAVAVLERMGKRLPDELEYLFAATLGGTRRYPWGNAPEAFWAPTGLNWPIGPVGTPASDRTPTDPPVAGLFSGVGEWTASWMAAGLGAMGRGFDADLRNQRVVRGVPLSILMGVPDPPGLVPQPATRLALSRRNHSKDNPMFPLFNVGYRGARSAEPRFLDPEP